MSPKIREYYQILEMILSQKNKEEVIYSTLDKLLKEIGEEKLFAILDLIDISKLDNPKKDKYGDDLSQKKNKGVRAYNRVVELSNTHHCVKWRCKHDVMYFIDNFVKIFNPAVRSLSPMKLRKFQETMVKALERADEDIELEFQDANDWENQKLTKTTVNFKDANRFICKIARQMGKSTLYIVYLLYKIVFFDNFVAGVIANKGSTTKEMVRRLQQSYALLPLWMQQGAKTWNKGSIELENGSIVLTSGLSPDAFTGYYIECLVMDEVAKWNSRIFAEIKNSLYPVVSSYGDHGKILIVTTPLGDNFFKDMWVDALNNIYSGGDIGSDFYPIEGTYRDDPLRNNARWVEKMTKDLGRRGFAQEYEARFLAMSGTLIDGDILSLMKPDIPIKNPHLEKMLPKYYKYISQYVLPQEKHTYLVIEDPNESTKEKKKNANDEPDGIGIQVIDITDIEKGWEQVLTVNIPGGEIHYLETDIICFKLAEHYNNAHIFIENNLGGKMIAASIERKFFYDKVYSEKPGIGGYRMSVDNKFLTGSLFKFIVEKGGLKIRDEDTITQLKFFKEDMKATIDMHDDLVMPLLGAFIFLLLDEDEIDELFRDDHLRITSALTIKEELLSSSNNFRERDTSHVLCMVQVLDDYINEYDLDDVDFYTIDDDGIVF